MSNSRSKKVAERLQTRVEHLERLRDPLSGFVVDDANTAFQGLYDSGPRPASVLVRSTFVARRKYLSLEGDRDPTSREKPPAADIVRSRGLALRLELGLLFVQQCTVKTGARLRPIEAKGDELGLINLFATGTRRSGASSYRKQRSAMRAAQVRNALDILDRRGLVELSPLVSDVSPYGRMWLSNEGGPAPGKDPARYTKLATTATTAEPTVSVPIEFFTHGWIQVMTDSEIWNWLVFRHAGKMSAASSPAGKDIPMPARLRLGWYDLTRDAWDTHAMLDSFELMTANPGEITSGSNAVGKQRFTKEPHLFDLDDSVLAKPGHAAVIAAVAAARDEALDE